MLIVEKKDFLVIPVKHKQTGEKILIKNFRFNPEIHEMIESGWSIEKVQNMHKKPAEIVVPQESAEEPTVEITVDPPSTEVTVPKKQRGRPKKS